MKQVEAAVIGTGWCGGIRAETLSRSALVDKLHVCEIRPDRLKEVQELTRAAHATLDYQDIVRNPAISVVYLHHTGADYGSRATPSRPASTCRWKSRSPCSCGNRRADWPGRRGGLKFTIGYSQRFNTKFAFAKKIVGRHHRQAGVRDGEPLIVAHLGKKIVSRVKLSPAAMQSTHDLDFVFRCSSPQSRCGSMRRAPTATACRPSTAPTIACGPP